MNTVPKINPKEATPVDPVATFAEAFVKLQAAIRPAIKDASNPAFRSKYADLAAVWEAVKQPLTDNGFSVIQSPDFDGDAIWLRTTILHTSGERMEGRYPLRPVKQDPQGYGSALTYARRYSLSAMLGVVADEDDDGNHASGVNGAGKPAPPPPPPQPKNDEDILAGMRNWVDQQKDIIIEFSDMDTLDGWRKKHASHGGREGNWDRPTPGSALDKILKFSPTLFNELKKYYLEKLVEI